MRHCNIVRYVALSRHTIVSESSYRLQWRDKISRRSNVYYTSPYNTEHLLGYHEPISNKSSNSGILGRIAPFAYRSVSNDYVDSAKKNWLTASDNLSCHTYKCNAMDNITKSRAKLFHFIFYVNYELSTTRAEKWNLDMQLWYKPPWYMSSTFTYLVARFIILTVVVYLLGTLIESEQPCPSLSFFLLAARPSGYTAAEPIRFCDIPKP